MKSIQLSKKRLCVDDINQLQCMSWGTNNARETVRCSEVEEAEEGLVFLTFHCHLFRSNFSHLLALFPLGEINVKGYG